MNTLNKLSRRLNTLLSLSNDLSVGARLAAKLPFFLRNPVTLENAKAVVKDRLERREASFLAIARKAIYQNPDSPYLKLLNFAGCEYGDLDKLVNKDGVEGALQNLFLNGVYLTVEEFKGRRPAIRGNQTVEVDPGSLRSPLSALHALARTSGSRGPRTMVVFDLKFIWDCAVNTCLALEAHGGRHWVKADWEGPGGGAAFRLLKFCCLGSPADRWFLRGDPDRQGRAQRWNTKLMQLGGRIAGVPIPDPAYVPHDEPLSIVHWMKGVIGAGETAYLFGFASSVVRLCQTAYDAGIGLRGAHFLMVGEPITAARLEVVRRTGAHGIPRYGSIETGPVGYGCLDPVAADDIHMFHDLHAFIQPESENAKVPPTALFVTSLSQTAPFLLLNVSMGDQAVITKRKCDCPMQAFGWSAHLHTVRSYEKLTAGGLTLLDTDVIRVLEELLPNRFGGVPTHYQLVEDESNGQPRLTLLVHPAVDVSDLSKVGETFLSGIGAGGHSLWRTPGFFNVEHREPVITASGKIHHVHLERPSAS